MNSASFPSRISIGESGRFSSPAKRDPQRDPQRTILAVTRRLFRRHRYIRPLAPLLGAGRGGGQSRVKQSDAGCRPNSESPASRDDEADPGSRRSLRAALRAIAPAESSLVPRCTEPSPAHLPCLSLLPSNVATLRLRGGAEAREKKRSPG
jgi:hypothetical protein